MSVDIDQTTEKKTASKGGKFLNFILSGEYYGLELLKIREIIGMMKITRVPNTPPFVRGVINLRGKVIPVIDLRVKFGMETMEDTVRTCVIVMQTENEGQMATTGIIVDEVCEVLNIPGEQIEPSPAMCADESNDMIQGVGKVADKVILLLDSDRVLNLSEVEMTEASAV